jgi:hypothetical protein
MTNELRYVIQKGTNYYVSSPVVAESNWGTTPRTNSVDNPATLVWHNNTMK